MNKCVIIITNHATIKLNSNCSLPELFMLPFEDVALASFAVESVTLPFSPTEASKIPVGQGKLNEFHLHKKKEIHHENQ